MKVFTPQISWHNRLPALSLDISKPTDDTGQHKYRVATGGNDCHLYIWLINVNDGEPEFRAGLRRHQRSIGAVRFSPLANLLASGDDDGYIYIWERRTDLENNDEPMISYLDDDGMEDLETWKQQRILRGHIEDICDLAWSKDGQFLLSGSVDNSAILWDIVKGTKVWCSDLIKGYVQGVAIDPHAQFMAAISSDRTLRIYNFSDKRLLNATRRMNIKGKYRAFFCDDTVKTFSRRLEFSPDGQFLLAPTSRLMEAKAIQPTSAETDSNEKNESQTSEETKRIDGSKTVTKEIEVIQIEDSTPSDESKQPQQGSQLQPQHQEQPDPLQALDQSQSEKQDQSQTEKQDQPQPQQQPNKNCTQALLVFKRSSFNKPIYYYPTGEVALCARFSPVVYCLRKNETNFWGIPYRIVFAVATTRTIIIYDSQQPTPLGYISQIHLARITDLAWSNDGRMLMVTSYDGYSSIVTFEPNEFGEIYTEPLIDPLAKPVVDEKKVDESLNENGKAIDEKPSKKGQKRMKAPTVGTVAAKKEKLNPESDGEADGESKKTPKKATPKKITPTRLPESATIWRYLNKKNVM